MQNSKKSLNLWPYFVVGSIVAVFFACVHTVVLALNNPVEFDMSYMQKKDKVDYNFNDLQANDKEYDKRFSTTLTLPKDNKNQIVNVDKEFYLPVKIVDKNNQALVDSAKIEILITRPDTNAMNQKPEFYAMRDGEYLFGPIVLPQVGRWQVLTQVNIDEFIGYPRYEIYANQ